MKTIGHGYYWNDLDVGFKFRTLNRTITESDLVGFVNTTGMLEMIFIDQTFAHEGGIKGRVVPAALPYALMEGLLCQTVQQMTGLALLVNLVFRRTAPPAAESQSAFHDRVFAKRHRASGPAGSRRVAAAEAPDPR